MVVNDEQSYRYLAESIRMHLNQERLKEMMEEAGLEQCDFHNMTGGVVAIHRGSSFDTDKAKRSIMTGRNHELVGTCLCRAGSSAEQLS